jgi:RNA-directed DNA polymerase
MKESYNEGLASHIGPESCDGGRKIDGEALTGAHAGQVSSCEISSGTPTPLSEAEGNIAGGAIGKPSTSPAQSQT